MTYFRCLQANKKRKEVDRRASKGRKIRYTVIDKLVNFMVPVEMQDDSRVASLFSNLFGHGLEAGGQVPAAS
jgi:protein AATF/BFR2